MRYVIALGGNALLRRGEHPDAVIQRHHVWEAAQALAPVIAEHEVIICHGNGPQIGLLADESAADPSLAGPYPLDALSAQTQGMIGYWIAQELANAGVVRPVAVLLTQTVVALDDPAFALPTKYIGPSWQREEAERYAARYGWHVAPDGPLWRRVVASPQPSAIHELPLVQQLLLLGVTVVCGGGGGIPVVADGPGWRGVDAVVDKDFTAALIAEAVGADKLVVLTDVPGVMRHFGQPNARPLDHITVEHRYSGGGRYPAGSMGPKVEACRRFVAATGRTAVIGALAQAPDVINGTSGTLISAVSTSDVERQSPKGTDREGAA